MIVLTILSSSMETLLARARGGRTGGPPPASQHRLVESRQS